MGQLFCEIDEFWGELDNMKAKWDLSWCLGGEFNLGRFSHEKKGNDSLGWEDV